MFDNVLELLLHRAAARSPKPVMMMVPEAWQNHDTDARIQAGLLRVPLVPDGAVGRPGVDRRSPTATTSARRSTATACAPAAITSRTDDRVIMASEVGVLRSRPARSCIEKGRLQPGRMFLVDFEQGRLIPDDELKKDIANARPTASGCESSGSSSRTCNAAAESHGFDPKTLLGADAGVRLHRRDDAVHAAADGLTKTRPDRLDGRTTRRLAVPQRPAADAVRLLQAALRAGDQPADRFDSRRSHHVARVLHRPRANLLDDDAGALPPLARCRNRFSRTNSWPALKQHGPPRLADARQSTSPGPRSEGKAGLTKRGSNAFATRPNRRIADGYSLVVLTDRGSVSDRSRPRDVRCWPWARCIITWFAKAKRTRIGLVLETGEAREVASPLLAGRLRRRRDQSVPGLRSPRGKPSRRRLAPPRT